MCSFGRGTSTDVHGRKISVNWGSLCYPIFFRNITFVGIALTDWLICVPPPRPPPPPAVHYPKSDFYVADRDVARGVQWVPMHPRSSAPPPPSPRGPLARLRGVTIVNFLGILTRLPAAKCVFWSVRGPNQYELSQMGPYGAGWGPGSIVKGAP